MTKQRRRKVGVAAALLACVLGVAYLFLVREHHVPDGCAFALDPARLRALASSVPGPRPTEIRVERVTTVEFPGAVVVTGHGWSSTELAVYAYQLVFPDRTIVVDTAMTAAQAREGGARDYDSAAWARLSHAMDAASAIYVTHEHPDHLGGLVARLADGDLLATARITPAQLEHPDRLAPLAISADTRARLQPLEVGAMRAVAPGVVLVSSPGHTPGSQMVFVQRADGTEVLLAGDAAWHMANVDEVRGPPRFVTYFGLHNDRDANVCQLAALHELARAHPEVHEVPGHDGPRVEQLVAAGVLVRGFR